MPGVGVQSSFSDSTTLNDNEDELHSLPYFMVHIRTD